MIDVTGLKQWAGLAGAPAGAAVTIAGIPYDGSAVYRKGAAQAPERIRSLSAVMPPVTEEGRLLAGLSVHDLGDITAGSSIEQEWQHIADRLAEVPPASLLTVIGGDHCTAIATLSAQARRHPGLSVLWVDAHPDLCDFSRGGRWTCGCALRRAIDASGIAPERVVIIGGRDYDPEELVYIRDHGMTLVGARELASTPDAALKTVADALAGKEVHVSFDIDVLDPAFAPGTEIPSPGGLTTRQALELLHVVGNAAKFVGLDMVEVSPPFDNGNISSLAALKVIFEFWGLARGGNS
ncbi:MAG: arginase family protein [Chloroflexi bacterium]|nr:MAG: arginase family protein [Chloroflexota bacterium]TME93632.1 MAG: arginase family protein [Chloroflexota bacterium]